jgi:uncharacterized protein (DUF433 family)
MTPKKITQVFIVIGEKMNNRISVNPNIHFGKPCVAGTRIPVQSVLELVSEGLSFTNIVQDYYSTLKFKDIQACIQYAIDVIAAEYIHITMEKAA